MTDAFDLFGMPPRLVVSEDELRSAFREAGKSAHPDAGGGEDHFARLCRAHEILTSPSRRLRHWLELRGIEVDARGVVDAALMDLFARVGDVTQRAESLIRKREETKSALGLAMLERETHLCREAVEETIRVVEAAIQEETSGFVRIETSEAIDPDAVSKTVRNLTFLEKWKAGLRSVFSRLV